MADVENTTGILNPPSSFYLPLLSDSSGEIFGEENTLSNFKVRLQQPLVLDGVWQVSHEVLSGVCMNCFFTH